MTGNCGVIKYRWQHAISVVINIMDLERSDSEDPFPKNNFKENQKPKKTRKCFLGYFSYQCLWLKE